MDIAYGLKNSRHTLKLASDHGARMTNVENGYARFEKVEQRAIQNNTTADIMQIYGIIRLEAGLSFENGSD